MDGEPSSSTLAPSSSPPSVFHDTRSVVFPGASSHNPHTGAVISKIEEILESVLDDLSGDRVLRIPIRSRRSGNERFVRFPATTDAEVKKFTSLLQILHLAHESLVSGTVITKRNIFYQNPQIFGSQAYVDKLVDDIAFTLGFGRDALNIVATSKGLAAGKVVIHTCSGCVVDCGSHENGVLLPNVRAIQGVDIGQTQWILVVEKDATFRGLAASRYFEESAFGPGLLITGKGYPDLNTRQFLYAVHASFPQVPVLALVDYDPHGIEIMYTYRGESSLLNHGDDIRMPDISWLGPKSSDVFKQSQDHYFLVGAAGSQTADSQSSSSQESSSSQRTDASSRARSLDTSGDVLSLTASDRRKATSLLEKTVTKEDHDLSTMEVMRELQIMLVLNIKAEMQALDDAGDMIPWLDGKMVAHHI